MSNALYPLVISAVVLTGMLLCLEIGYRIGLRPSERALDPSHRSVTAIEAAIFGLLGLMLAFTFSDANERLTHRRRQIVEEANAMGTAYLRIGVLSPEDQAALRPLFRRYVDLRLKAYADVLDQKATADALAEASSLQNQIWSQSVSACRKQRDYASVLLLPALNEMFDITTARYIAAQTHIPALILGLLCCLALCSSLLAGNVMAGRGSRNVLQLVLFTAAVTATVFTIVDLEFPRIGFIRLDAADEALRQVQRAMQ